MTKTATQTIPKGYKQTEIGVIPEDWEVKKLGRACEQITTGKLDANAMEKNGEYRFYTCAKEHYFIDKYAFDTEALLVSGNGANVGYIHYYKGKFNAYQRTYVLSNFKENIFFTKLLLDKNLKERIRTEVNAGNTPYITMGTLTEMNIAFPKKSEEQEVIVTSLFDTDKLIEKLEKLIEKKRAIKQGAMQELLTGKKRLPGFSGEWKEKSLGEVAKFERGQGLSKADLQETGKYKCIHYGQLFSGYAELIKEVGSKTNYDGVRFFSKSNDVLMPTSDVTPRGLATASCIKEDGVVLGGGILVIRFDSDYDGTFFSYWVTQNKSDVLKLTKGSTVFHIYADDMAELKIKFPKHEEQAAIANVISDMDAEINALEKSLKKYRQIKTGMMQNLLTGKIRLIKN